MLTSIFNQHLAQLSRESTYFSAGISCRQIAKMLTELSVVSEKIRSLRSSGYFCYVLLKKGNVTWTLGQFIFQVTICTFTEWLGNILDNSLFPSIGPLPFEALPTKKLLKLHKRDSSGRTLIWPLCVHVRWQIERNWNFRQVSDVSRKTESSLLMHLNCIHDFLHPPMSFCPRLSCWMQNIQNRYCFETLGPLQGQRWWSVSRNWCFHQ